MIEFLDKDDTSEHLDQQMVDDIEMVSEDEGIVADQSSGTMFISNIYELCKKLIFVQGKGQRLQNWFFCFYQLDIIQRC